MAAKNTLQFRGTTIPVDVAAPPKVEDFLNCPYFTRWVSDLAANPSFNLHGVTLQSLDYSHAGVRSAAFRADLEHDGVKVSGRSLVRAPIVVILVILIDSATGDEYYLFVKQPRATLGRESLETVAGKTEPSDDSPRAAARRELEEETGLANIPDDQFIDLTALAFGESGNGEVPIAGLLNHGIHYFYYRAVCPIERIRELDGQTHGVAASEQITTRVIARKDLRSVSADAKHFTAIGLLRILQEDGLLA
jgi:8-oxo-dGTP pyrophosphatase MutT (NUDIX family)